MTSFDEWWDEFWMKQGVDAPVTCDRESVRLAYEYIFHPHEYSESIAKILVLTKSVGDLMNDMQFEQAEREVRVLQKVVHGLAAYITARNME